MKINAQLPEEVIRITGMLESAGYEAYLVGGCVRDILLGRGPSDYDITTDAVPDEVERIFCDFKTVTVGKEHGTVGVAMHGKLYEITTYRVDGKYEDHRRPDEVSFTRSLEEDLKRRDFTVNAIAMDAAGNVVDKVGGVADLKAKRLRTVGAARERFSEDALRIMRGIRFEAALGFDLDEEAVKAANELAPDLGRISVERIRVEFDKMLVSPGAGKALRKYRDIIATVIPEIREMFDFDQHNPYHDYDVYEHSVIAVENVPADITLRLAALFHDIGKPSCFVVKDGWGHFYGHERRSAEIAKVIMRRLKYDRKTTEAVTDLISKHGTIFTLDERYAARKIARIGEDTLYGLIALERADVSAQAEWVRQERIDYIDRFEGIIDDVIARESCFKIKDLEINGRDLIDIGFSQGPGIGMALNALFERALSGELKNDREVLLAEAKKFL